MVCFIRYDSPVGPLLIAEDGTGICRLSFSDAAEKDWAERATPLLQKAADQLNEYFAGRRRRFDLPLSLKGTAFQRAVWNALCAVPYGESCSYGEIAAAVGRPKACRAVGQANNRNPVAILVPCHRVVGKDGRLTGYAAGVSVKERLLRLEAVVADGGDMSGRQKEEER